MAASKIPEEIKKHRPGPCTEVKLINVITMFTCTNPCSFPAESGEKRPEKVLAPLSLTKALFQTEIIICMKVRNLRMRSLCLSTGNTR